MEVIVIDNDSNDDTVQMIRDTYPSVIILHQQNNTGIPGGRNIGIRNARGDICVCIDDDAEFIDTQAIRKSAEYFLNDNKLSCLSMRIIDRNDKIVRKLIPRRDRKEITEDTPGAMFSGTGFAISRSAFMEVGGFWEDLNPYFGEEPELSYRLLDIGYTILHTPHIIIRHYETPVERPTSRRIYFGARNAPWLALRNLPWYSVVSLTILSWGYFLIIGIINRQIPMVCQAMWASIKHMPAIWRIRKPISSRTRRIIWCNSGLLVW
jgi:GT2 family glycosyltransferase